MHASHKLWAWLSSLQEMDLPEHPQLTAKDRMLVVSLFILKNRPGSQSMPEAQMAVTSSVSCIWWVSRRGDCDRAADVVPKLKNCF